MIRLLQQTLLQQTLLQQTWQTLMAHRMKSMLAIVAIAWGVISVVVLIALG